MRRLKIWLCVLIVIFVASLIGCLLYTHFLLISVANITNYELASLRWSIIGAVGGWIGSIFGAISLVVSLAALWLPQIVSFTVSFSYGFTTVCDNGKNLYIITVTNVGMRPIVINNIYFHFGRKRNKDMILSNFVWRPEDPECTVTFPKRLEQGEAFNYYLDEGELNLALRRLKDVSSNAPLRIRVDEASEGVMYFRTKCKLKSFIS